MRCRSQWRCCTSLLHFSALRTERPSLRSPRCRSKSEGLNLIRGVSSIHALVASTQPVAHLLNFLGGKHVLAHESANGREATDTRGRQAPADVETNGRVIEVKAFGLSARGNDLWLETRQFDEARTNGQFHIYVVENVRQGNPAAFRLIDLHGEVLARLLERARPQSYVTVPFPVGAYDAAVAGK